MLRIFGQFTNIILEMYGSDDDIKIMEKYGVLTGNRCCDVETAFINRKGKNWQKMYRVFFDAPLGVVESLRKLGCNVRENKMPDSIKESYGSMAKFPYTFSNDYWFWKLVEYGYRLGTNVNIPFSLYLLHKHLAEMEIEPLYNITKVESEPPVVEAQLLVA